MLREFLAPPPVPARGRPQGATGGRPYNNGRRHSVALAYPTLLFAEGDIKNPMQTVVYDICVCNSPDRVSFLVFSVC
jgi:hypothetical protein